MATKHFLDHKNHNAGFTLVELLLASVLTGTLVVILSGTLIIIMQTRTKSRTISEVEQQGQAATLALTRLIRNSQTIIEPTTGQTGQTLVVNDGSSTTISVSDGKLMWQADGQEQVELTDTKLEISNLMFTNASAAGTSGNINISFTLAYKQTFPRYDYTYTKNYVAAASLKQ